MVGLWLPEPPNGSPLDEIQASDDIVIPATDTSDTDEEVNLYDGYEPLPLGPVDIDNSQSSEDESDSQSLNVNPSMSESLPPIVPMDRVLVKEVWSGPPPEFVDIEMDPAKANEVKMAMANFTLPSTSFPEWAATIPEHQWKEQLISRIQNLQHKSEKL